MFIGVIRSSSSISGRCWPLSHSTWPASPRTARPWTTPQACSPATSRSPPQRGQRSAAQHPAQPRTAGTSATEHPCVVNGQSCLSAFMLYGRVSQVAYVLAVAKRLIKPAMSKDVSRTSISRRKIGAHTSRHRVGRSTYHSRSIGGEENNCRRNILGLDPWHA